MSENSLVLLMTETVKECECGSPYFTCRLPLGISVESEKIVDCLGWQQPLTVRPPPLLFFFHKEICSMNQFCGLFVFFFWTIVLTFFSGV